ncbi:MAG: transcriptional regulator [Thermoplasmataceae archaeon]
MTEDLDEIMNALLNNTRREILKILTVDNSYALEMSKWLGVSQQAINKQLEMLEKAKLISLAGLVPSNAGASRKLYRPSGFSTITIDYSRNFFEIKRMELQYSNDDYVLKSEGNRELLQDLEKINGEIDELMSMRTNLLNRKDEILDALHRSVSDNSDSSLERNILLSYLEQMDQEAVAEKLSIPIDLVSHVVGKFMNQ